MLDLLAIPICHEWYQRFETTDQIPFLAIDCSRFSNPENVLEYPHLNPTILCYYATYAFIGGKHPWLWKELTTVPYYSNYSSVSSWSWFLPTKFDVLRPWNAYSVCFYYCSTSSKIPR